MLPQLLPPAALILRTCRAAMPLRYAAVSARADTRGSYDVDVTRAALLFKIRYVIIVMMTSCRAYVMILMLRRWIRY